MAGTTIFINPLMGDLKIQTTLGGMFALPGQKIIQAVWPNGGSGGGSLLPSSAAAAVGMNALYDRIIENLATMTLADPLLVVGHSGGAQIIMRLLREKGAALQAAITAAGKTIAMIKFYCLGSPEQKFTGASYLYPANSPAIYPGDGTKCGASGAHDGTCPSAYPSQHGGYGVGFGLPLTCPFTVHVVSNQYDGWSQAPTNMAHGQLNKIYDIFLFFLPRKVWDHNPICYLKSTTGPHGLYHAKDSKSLSSPDAFSYVDPAQPTVTYWYIRWFRFPGFDKAKFFKKIVRDLDQKHRASIDTAYAATDSTHGMQISIPAPDYTVTSSWF